MKRFTHDADLRGMVVLRSLGFQLVPFKLHRFRKQRPMTSVMGFLVSGDPDVALAPYSVRNSYTASIILYNCYN
ncbi:hypothetical protein [Aeromonas salmonicida]|uniref:hypothetical protein n=1 Tax=Aeromonas salmonicida TaxID=645 RepID=UPI0012D88CEF|nr:hypothetical protein [Aeromonas salmonicida]